MNACLGRALISGILVFASSVVGAAPTNLLVNPGFETGDFTGWAVTGTSPQVGVATDGTTILGADPPFLPNFQNVRSGDFAGNGLIRNGPAVAPDFEIVVLSQTVAVLPNEEMSAGFWLGNDSGSAFGMPFGSPGRTQIYIDDVGLLPLTTGVSIFPGSSPAAFVLLAGGFNTGARGSIDISFAITGSGTSRVGVSFDDFFVVSGPPPVAIPEPGAWSLLSLGLAVLAFARRRRAAHGLASKG